MPRVLLVTWPALAVLAAGCPDGEREALEAHNRALLQRAEQLEQRNAELEQRNAELEQRYAELETELREISIELPLPGMRGDDDEALETMTVLVTADGSLYLDGRPADEEDVATRAGELGDRGRATIAADERVRHARVVEVIDLLRSNGVERFSVAVSSQDEPQ